MMLEVTGARLARRCLEAAAADGHRLPEVTLAEFLPQRPIGWPCWPEISAISASIPLASLTIPEATPEAFTAQLYELIEKHEMPAQRCGEVMGFFRGFCRAFFRDVPTTSSHLRPSSSKPQEPLLAVPERPEDPQHPESLPELQQPSNRGLLNFNELLEILLNWDSRGSRLASRDHLGDPCSPEEIVPTLVLLIQAMEHEERMQPELLLGGFCADQCILRRKRLSYAADIEIEWVEAFLLIMSRLRRFRRSSPLSPSRADLL